MTVAAVWLNSKAPKSFSGLGAFLLAVPLMASSGRPRDVLPPTTLSLTRQAAMALLLLALLFQRSGNIRRMEWPELALDAAMWAFPAQTIKRSKQAKIIKRLRHLMPLALQAIE